MNILITGSHGQLGCELVKQAGLLNYNILGLDLPHFNITDYKQVKNSLEGFHPSLIINAAAYTKVDQAETETELAFAVNKNGTANLAEICAQADIPLIHISTDFVFNGKKGAPYTETDPVSPINVYGKSKAEGERQIRSILKKHIILRTSWLYGAYGLNFVKTMLNLAKKEVSIKVVADQYGSPTSATDLAEAVLTIASSFRNRAQTDWGTYHYAGLGVTTWYGFAKSIFETARKYDSMGIINLEPVTTSGYPVKARRPAFSALDCSLITKNFNIKPKPWNTSLQKVIDSILSDTAPF